MSDVLIMWPVPPVLSGNQHGRSSVQSLEVHIGLEMHASPLQWLLMVVVRDHLYKGKKTSGQFNTVYGYVLYGTN